MVLVSCFGGCLSVATRGDLSNIISCLLFVLARSLARWLPWPPELSYSLSALVAMPPLIVVAFVVADVVAGAVP